LYIAVIGDSIMDHPVMVQTNAGGGGGGGCDADKEADEAKEADGAEETEEAEEAEEVASRGVENNIFSTLKAILQ
jgi:hypothetical protein